MTPMQIVNGTSINTDDLNNILLAATHRASLHQQYGQKTPGRKMYVIWSQKTVEPAKRYYACNELTDLTVLPNSRGGANNIMPILPLLSSYSPQEAIARAEGEFELPLSYVVDIYTWMCAQLIRNEYYNQWADFTDRMVEVKALNLKLGATWPKRSRFHIPGWLRKELSIYRKNELNYRRVRETLYSSERYKKKMGAVIAGSKRLPCLVEKGQELMGQWDEYATHLKAEHDRLQDELEKL